MIYTTDLDRTVIYSNRVLLNYPSEIGCTVVEAVDGEDISFTSTAFFKWISERDSNSALKIVANTARSRREFERIFIHKNFDYGIVANGGVIIHRNKILKDWETQLDRGYIQEILVELLNKLSILNINGKIIEDSYIFIKLANDSEDIETIQELMEDYREVRVVIQRNKTYLIPNIISKEKAIIWLANYLGEDIAIASGDSLMDLEMLRTANISIVPEHGELIQKSLFEPKIKVSGGVQASSDILKIIENYCQ